MPMKYLIEKHKPHWTQKSYLSSVSFGLLFLILSLVVNYNAVIYASAKAGNPVYDLLLDYLPVRNMDFVFVWGAIIFLSIVLLILINRPKFIPFVLKSAAIFILVRSFFIILTHIGPLPNQPLLDLNRFFKIFTYEGDLFFSGHTGFPYLMALIFWKDKILRWVFISCSLIAGFSVLLGRLHYSIDVFAAFFITFGVFHICKNLFKADYDYANKD